jgi:hypothetical protein
MASSLLRRKRIWVPLVLLLFLAAIGAALYLRGQTAPEAARLLPESDAVLYVDLKPLRTFSGFGNTAVVHDPDYDQFVRDTGFQLERDLDEAAIAVHSPEPAGDPLHPEAKERRFSQVLIGTFDSTKLTHYLHKLATEVERYRDTDVFLIPHEGRKVRVAILTFDTVAVSNTADAANIHGIIDRFRQIALPFRGPTLVRGYYRHVPLGATAWAILQMKAPDGQSVTLPLPNGIGFTLPKDTVTVASLRYLGSISFKTEAFTTSDADAKKLADSVSNFLNLFHSIENNTDPSGSDKDVKLFFDSIKVEQNGTRAILTADLPIGFVKKIVSEGPGVEAPKAPGPAEQPKGAQPGKKKLKKK